MTEKWVQAKIRDLLDVRNIPNQKIPGSMLLKGMPDLYCGRFWIEVKRPGGKLRPSQVEWCERFDRSAAIYVVDDHRKLWDVIGDPKPGSRPNNWRSYAPRIHHRDRLKAALNEWSEDRTSDTPANS